jgi:antidote-toxin recognition MazE-like antitoxin
MAQPNASIVKQHRARQRAKGLRLVQLWLPDSHSPRFKAQVAHDIGALKHLSAEDEAMVDAFERVAAEGLREWS